MQYKNKGIWSPLHFPRLNVNGRWKDVKSVYVKENGDWKLNTIYRADIELKSAGANDTHTSRYIKFDGETILTATRGWAIAIFSDDMTSYQTFRYDTYGSSANASSLTSKLQSLKAGTLVGFITWDEPQRNISSNSSFKNEMAKFGADTTAISSLGYRSSYLLLAHKFGKKYVESSAPRSYGSYNRETAEVFVDPRKFGRMTDENWDQYKSGYFGGNSQFQTSYGYISMDDSKWHNAEISTLSDWAANPESMKYMLSGHDTYTGQVVLGNRLSIEMGNNRSNSPAIPLITDKRNPYKEMEFSFDDNLKDVSQQNNPYSHFKFNESLKDNGLVNSKARLLSDVVSDSSNNGNNGSIHGAEWVEDMNDNVLSFDGIDDYVSIPVAVTMSQSGATFSGWFYINNFTSDSYTNGVYVTSVDETTHSIMIFYNGSFGYESDNNGSPMELYDDDDTSHSIPSITEKSWFHFALVFDNGTARYYGNGQEYGSFPIENDLTIKNFGRKIGGSEYYPDWFDGKMYDVRIYNTALTGNEISNIYSSVDGGTLDNLAGRWIFEDNIETSYFNGSSYLNLGKSFHPWENKLFTSTFWFKTSVLNDSDMFWGKEFESELGVSAGGKFVVYNGDGSSWYSRLEFTDATQYADNNWHFLVLRQTGSNEIELWVDNNLLDRKNYSSPDGINKSEDMGIGQRGDLGWDYYEGYMSDLRFYSRSITDDEMIYLFNNPDKNLNHTTNNNTSFENPRDRVYGKSISFNNSDSFMLSDYTLEDSIEKSISLWVKFNSQNGYVFDTRYNTNEGFYVLKNSDGIIEYGQDGDFNVKKITEFEPENDVWYHIGLIYDKTFSTFTFYVNGKENDIIENYTNRSKFGNLVLGNSINMNESFGGSIDDVKVYNYSIKDSMEFLYKDTKDLKVWYPFNGSFEEASHNRNTLYPSSYSFVTGIQGQALDFNSLSESIVSDFYYPGGHETLEMTAMMWVYFRDTSAQYLASMDRSENWRFQLQSSAKLGYLTQMNNGIHDYYTGSTLGVNRWYHLAITMNRGVKKVYIDGRAKNNSASGNKMVSRVTRYLTLGGSNELGSFSTNGTTRDFTGFMGDFKYYERELSEEEINFYIEEKSLIKNNRITDDSLEVFTDFSEVQPVNSIDPTNLELSYDFNRDIYDSSGNDRDWNSENSGLFYRYYENYAWRQANGLTHPDTTAEFDEYFQDEHLKSSGTFSGRINWAESGRDPMPSYVSGEYYSWQVDGLIYIPATGTWTFRVDGDDACDIHVDNQLVSYKYGGGGFSYGSSTDIPIELKKGWHLFKARLEEYSGGSGIATYWSGPTIGGLQLIPGEYFYRVGFQEYEWQKVEFNFQKGSSFPSDPERGDEFYNTNTQKLHKYSGSSWAEIFIDYQLIESQSDGIKIFTSGKEFPPGPSLGDECYRHDTRKLFKYTGDEWVEINIIIYDIDDIDFNSGIDFPHAERTGDYFFRSDIDRLYKFNGDSWQETKITLETIHYLKSNFTLRLFGQAGGHIEVYDDVYRLSKNEGSFAVRLFIEDLSETKYIFNTRENNDRSLYITTDGTLTGEVYSNTTYKVESNRKLETYQWYHIAFTYSKSNGEMKIYVDGVEENSSSVTITDANNNSSRNIVGASSNTENLFIGRMAELVVYSRALNQSEINLLYSDPSSSIRHGQIRDYAEDRDLILYGQNRKVIGINGYGIEFNKSNGWIQIDDLSITGSMTLSYWTNLNSFYNRQNPFNQSYGGEGTITLETDGTMRYYYGESGTDVAPYSSFRTTTALTTGRWYHVCVVRDLENMKIRWYINGSLDVESDAPYSSATASNFPIYIGRGYKNPYDGVITDFRLYSRALKENEVVSMVSNSDWNKVGDIVRINSGTQDYYVQKIYGGEIWEDGGNSDDDGVWEVVDIKESNRGRNISTTNAWHINRLGYTKKFFHEIDYGLNYKNPGRDAMDILIRNPYTKNRDGVYWLQPPGYSQPEPFWCDMTTDGGGWTVVVAADMDSSAQYPSAQLSGFSMPTSNPNDATYGYKYIWPEYTEWSARSIYSKDYADATTTSRFWKWSTGNWGRVQANLLYAAYVDQDHTQDGRFDPQMADNFEEARNTMYRYDRPDHWYYSYRWFDKSVVNWYWWGQWTLMGKVVQTDIFNTSSAKTNWISKYGCGAGWNKTSCRTGKQAHIQRGNYVGKLVIMVRDNSSNYVGDTEYGTTQSNPGKSGVDILSKNPNADDGLYWIKPDGYDGEPYQIYCRMNDGGWMLLAKMKGTDNIFEYSSSHWTTESTLNEDSLNLDNVNAKFKAFNYNTLSRIRADFYSIGHEMEMGTNKTALQQFQTQNIMQTGVTNDRSWYEFDENNFPYENGFVQYGTNLTCTERASVRWGWMMNNETTCSSNDCSAGIGLTYGSGEKAACAGGWAKCCAENLPDGAYPYPVRLWGK